MSYEENYEKLFFYIAEQGQVKMVEPKIKIYAQQVTGLLQSSRAGPGE